MKPDIRYDPNEKKMEIAWKNPLFNWKLLQGRYIPIPITYSSVVSIYRAEFPFLFQLVLHIPVYSCHNNSQVLLQELGDIVLVLIL